MVRQHQVLSGVCERHTQSLSKQSLWCQRINQVQLHAVCTYLFFGAELYSPLIRHSPCQRQWHKQLFSRNLWITAGDLQEVRPEIGRGQSNYRKHWSCTLQEVTSTRGLQPRRSCVQIMGSFDNFIRTLFQQGLSHKFLCSQIGCSSLWFRPASDGLNHVETIKWKSCHCYEKGSINQKTWIDLGVGLRT